MEGSQPRSGSHPPRWAALAAAALAALALAALLREQLYPGGDALIALGWGNELLAGNRPNFAVWAPAKHPLTIGYGAGASLFSPGFAVTLLVASSIASFAVLGYATYRLGRLLAGPFAGGLAAAALLTRPELFDLLARTQKDLPFAALTVLAAALLAEDPRRRWPAAMGLLVAAGLIRPEAWALSVLLALWVLVRLRPRRGWVPAALAAAAPLTWWTFDLIVASDPLHTLKERIRKGESISDRDADEAEPAAERFVDVLDAGIVETVTVGVALGGLLALVIAAWLARRPDGRAAALRSPAGWVVTAAPLAVGVAALALIVLLETAAAARFLLVAASVLVVAWAGLIGLGATAKAVRTPALAGLAGGILTLALAVGDDINRIEASIDRRELASSIFDDAVELAARDDVGSALAACDRTAIGPPSVVTASARATLSLELGRTMREIQIRQLTVPPPPGTAVFAIVNPLERTPRDLASPLARVGGWRFFDCASP